jgi:hypothetical protein
MANSSMANSGKANCAGAPTRAVISGKRMTGLRLLGVLGAALGVALLLNAAVCLLPENDYQRWRLADESMGGGRLRWIYERIHFDPKPIDIAIFGPSRAQLGLSAAAVEQKLAQRGKHANVVNFALPGDGRDIQWAILDELFRAKPPKVVVLEVEEQPYPFGHFAFRHLAPAFITIFTISLICRSAN